MSGLRRSLACLLLLVASIGRAETTLVVTPVDSPLSREFASALATARPERQVELFVLGTGSPPAAIELVTMGAEGLAWRLAQPDDRPTIATYVGAERLQRLAPEPLPRHVQVLLHNPDPARQIDLARLVFPRLRSVGVLFSEASQPQRGAWEAAAAGAGLQLHSADASSPREIGRSVAELLERSDVLMAVDDSQIYNADNLKTLLLTSYRQGRVLIGPGPTFVPAGALTTTFSTVEDTARSAAVLLTAPWQPGQISYPEHFSVTSNLHVARSLGLPPLDDAALAQAIRLMRVSQ